MRLNEKIKKCLEILSDIKSMNFIVFISYVVCAVIYALLGYNMFFVSEFTGEKWQPVLYYILLGLPVVLASVDYSESKYGMEFRYSLYLPALFFYGYLLLLKDDYLYFLFGVCMIGMSTIYCDLRFSGVLSMVMLAFHVLAIILQNGEGSVGKRVFHMGLMVVIVFFFNFSSGVIATIRNAKLADINEERQRFQALAALDGKRIFEYDFKKDRMYITKNMGEEEEEKRTFDNISKEAKLQRHVLYADWKALDQFVTDCKAGKQNISAQLRLRDHKADYLWHQFNGKTLYDSNGELRSIIGTIENIDDRKRMELRIADESMRDPLTKLYERTQVQKLIEDYLSKQDGSEYAGLMLVDVDDFTSLVDKMGITFADELLKSLASDLDEIFYTSDILGRIGGDAFVILMKNIKKIPDIEKKMKEIQDVVRRSYSEEEIKVATTVTIGAAVFPIDGKNWERLYSSAEKALVYEKEKGKNRYGLYDHNKEDEYEKLEIEEIHNKIAKKHAMDMEGEHVASESLIELAFKLIDESKDTDSAINLLLRQITRQLGLDAICVRSRVGLEYKMTYPYRCILGNCTLDEDDIELPKEAWDKGMERLRANNGFISCENVDEIENEVLRESCKKHGIRAYTRCAYYEKDEYGGSLYFVSCDQKRVWTKEDKMTMQAVTKIISAYLLKMKAYENASYMIEKLTGYDAITGFYKYEKFLDLAQKFLETAKNGRYAIVYLDFSNFKYINEIYGYEVGDKILRICAEGAEEYKERFIMGSRVFSDNMICLLDIDGWNDSQLLETLDEGGKGFSDKIRSTYFDSNVVCIMGVCPFVVDGSEVPLKNIISSANLARKEAKKPENSNCIIYDESMGSALQKEVEYEKDMNNAFRNNEFVVYMQPKIDLKNHKIIGAEALIRWIKSDGRMIFPNDFIPVFEKNKSITVLDYFVYEEVCKYLEERVKRGEHIVNISMNVSKVHLQEIDKMVSYVKGLLQKYNLNPEWLEFELTETISTERIEDTVEMLTKLRTLGVKVSMDDFGSGYSSLNLLTKLPLDVLKLDKEFLRDFDSDSDEKVIIPSIIDMAKKLKLDVVCEGVETKQQAEFLRDVECDIAQGYYYSRPVPLEAFSGMLADENFVINQENRED